MRYMPLKIYGRKQISQQCNRIEHWVHTICAGIRQAQYTDTRNSHLHRESRLTTHTDISPHHPSRPWSKTLTHSPPTLPHYGNPNTDIQTHSPFPTGLVKPKPNPLIYSPASPLTCLSTHATPSQTHIHLTYSANFSHPMYDTSLNHVHHPNDLHSPHVILAPYQHCHYPQTLSVYTHTTQTTVNASQLQHPTAST